MAKITVDYPEVAKGAPVEIPGYGVFPNGETSEYEGDTDYLFTSKPLDDKKSKGKSDSTSEEGDK